MGDNLEVIIIIIIKYDKLHVNYVVFIYKKVQLFATLKDKL